ncbi:MAG: zinc-ribbon domain containing protein [Peptococcaceae bacterium]|jgi:CxxC-x17-CxxC domain-containing protein|nr:zinc-ribbon domain containing protein [Peptococcaceae bacterium]
MIEDKTLTCRECGQEFIFSASEQEFYAEKGFQNDPGRCLQCRQARKQSRNGGFARAPRTMYPTVCAECGCETEVPFQPSGDKPVYCRQCFDARRQY